MHNLKIIQILQQVNDSITEDTKEELRLDHLMGDKEENNDR